MSAPRHLWSGDWRLDSAAAADELARRRAEAEAPTETPEPDEDPQARDNVAPLRRHAAVLVAVLATLLVAGAAYAAVSLIAGSGGNSSNNASGAPAYLGIQMAHTPFSFPGRGSGFPFVNGAMVNNVAPGSPAAAAGLMPGDVITNIDNHPVANPAQVNAAIARLHAGDHVQIQYVQSFTTYTTQATLTKPPGSP